LIPFRDADFGTYELQIADFGLRNEKNEKIQVAGCRLPIFLKRATIFEPATRNT